MKKFLKDTRGVVMMEYIILGCFAVAVTVVAVLALGNVYNNGILSMGWATLGQAKNAQTVQVATEAFFATSSNEAGLYIEAMGTDANGGNTVHATATATAPTVY